MVTPGYGPIEQYAGGGRQGPWTDIYSMGATLFWLMSGRKPLDAPARLDDPEAMPSAEALGRGRFSLEFLRAIDWRCRCIPRTGRKAWRSFAPRSFASHAGALGLQEALRRTEEDQGFARAEESWATTLRSPRRIKSRLARLARTIRRPGSWPIAVKMTFAMVATALAPMIITAYYNLDATQGYVADVELRNLEQLAQSTAGRIAQLITGMKQLAGLRGHRRRLR